MLNLPFVTQPSAPKETAAPTKPTEPKREKDDFSKAYEKVDNAKDRPSDDVSEAKSVPDGRTDDSAKEAESRPDKGGDQTGDKDSEAKPDAPEDADFAAVEIAETVEDAPEVAPKEAEVKAAKGAPENAALMKLGTQTEAVDKTVAAVPKTTEVKAPAADVQATPKVAEVDPKADPKAAKLVAETPEGLDPMRVTVRNLGGQQAQAAEIAKPEVLKPVQEAGRSKDIKLSAESVEEAKAPKVETPSVPTTSTTQQMQARAIMEQVNSGGAMMNTRGNDIQASQNADVLVAAVDDGNNSSRSIMSAQEAASQARLNNSAPNPAYVVRQLADAVRMTDKSLIELAMDPPELGKVRMSMSEAGGVMTINIAAENQATTELMRRHIDMLRKDFMELGYQDVAFSFEQSGSGGQQQAGADQDFGQGGHGAGAGRQGDGSMMADPAMLAAQQQQPQSLVNSGLDIRV